MPEPTAEPTTKPVKRSLVPKPHRCYPHLEDVLVGLNKWPVEFSKPFGVFWECMKSEPGQEPERYKSATVPKPEANSP